MLVKSPSRHLVCLVLAIAAGICVIFENPLWLGTALGYGFDWAQSLSAPTFALLLLFAGIFIVVVSGRWLTIVLLVAALVWSAPGIDSPWLNNEVWAAIKRLFGDGVGAANLYVEYRGMASRIIYEMILALIGIVAVLFMLWQRQRGKRAPTSRK